SAQLRLERLQVGIERRLRLEGGEAVLEAVGVELRRGLGARFLVADLVLHPVEGGEGAAGVDALERGVDALLGLGATAARDQQVALALRLADLVLQLLERALEDLDLLVLLLVLLLEAVGDLLVAVAARERLAGEVVLALGDRQLGLPLPAIGLLL